MAADPEAAIKAKPPKTGPLFCLDITEPGRAIGYLLLTDPAPEDDWSIYGTREGRTWTVWTDSHGSATGSTLEVAAKRWARQYGLPHGTATLGNDNGGERRISW